jgi:branched-chain amino acid transport system substrate-binding protein
MFVTDVLALGQDACAGLVLTNSFYWDLTPKTRAWTERFAKRMNLPPTMNQAADYTAAMHWMRAVKAAGSFDGDTVAAKMHAMPVNDFYHDDVPIQANGQCLDPMHVWRVKPTAQAKYKWDFYEPISTIDGKDSFIPMGESGCKLT